MLQSFSTSIGKAVKGRNGRCPDRQGDTSSFARWIIKIRARGRGRCGVLSLRTWVLLLARKRDGNSGDQRGWRVGERVVHRTVRRFESRRGTPQNLQRMRRGKSRRWHAGKRSDLEEDAIAEQGSFPGSGGFRPKKVPRTNRSRFTSASGFAARGRWTIC